MSQFLNNLQAVSNSVSNPSISEHVPKWFGSTDYAGNRNCSSKVDFQKERELNLRPDWMIGCRYEMERPSRIGEDNEEFVVASNVAIGMSREADTDIQDVSKECAWGPLVSSDIKPDYSQIVDRWINVADFEWKQDNNSNDKVLSVDLPRTCITTTSLRSVPNVIPFRIHRYWRGDIEIRILLNSNRFLCGTLLCSWWYQDTLDNKFQYRDNVYSASQTTHAFVDASHSNEVIIKVPYKNFTPFLHTKKRKDCPVPLRLGSLRIYVLNKLKAGTSNLSSVYGQVYVKFPNSVFTGMVDMEYANEMDVMKGIVKGAECFLNQVAPDRNRDNPSDVRPPSYMVPTASHSWSAGTDISEPLHALRLNPRGQTPHPDGDLDEMRIDYVARKWGLLQVISWKKEHKSKHLLVSLDAAPLLDVTNYAGSSNQSPSKLTYYFIPPVGVLASMYNLWRGEIEYRFDFVCTDFHTGRIIAGFVPGAYEAAGVTYDIIKSSPHIVFSLQEQRSFTFSIPYVANKPYWPRKFTGNYKAEQVLCPSMLFLYVCNPLSMTDNVASEIDINIFMRAGENFEVAIPCQPSFGLCFNIDIRFPKSDICIPNYYPIMANAINLKNNICIAMSKNNTKPEWVGFPSIFAETPEGHFIYKAIEGVTNFTYKSSGINKTVNFEIGVLYKFNNDWIMLYCVDEQAARNAARVYIKDPNNLDFFKYIFTCKAGEFTGSTASVGVPKFQAISFPTVYESELPVNKLYPDLNLVRFEGDNDEVTPAVQLGGLLQSTNFGESLFGESFASLKDLCRRYQVYAMFNIDPNKQVNIGQVSAILPILPQGLDLLLGSIPRPVEFMNRCRDGHIPIVLSGYRHFRGSLRFRIIAPCEGDIILWVQHVPDRKLRSTQAILEYKVESAEILVNHSYASYFQHMGVNGILEFSVPFYQPGSYGLLQRPKYNVNAPVEADYYFSLGELKIGFSWASNEQKTIKSIAPVVFYSLDDDFSASTFQGFPPMVFLDDIQRFDIDKKVIAPHLYYPEMMSWVPNFKVPIKYLLGVDETTAFIKQEVRGVAQTANETLESFKLSSENSLSDFFLNNPVARSAVSQLTHCFINPNIKTVSWSIISFLFELGIITTKTFNSSISALQKVMLNCVSIPGNEQNDPATPVYSPEMEGVSVAMLGFVQVMWTGVCSLLALNGSKNSKKSWCDLLCKDFKDIFICSNAMFTWIKNLLSCLGEMFQYGFGLSCPRYLALEKLANASEFIQIWCKEVLYLLSPKRKCDLLYDCQYQDRVYSAYDQGCMIMSKAIELESKQLVFLQRLFNQLVELHTELVDNGIDPHVRKEPFVIWCTGLPGVGKSSVMPSVCSTLLSAQNYKTKKNMICVVNPLCKYWDNCDRQPVLAVDDMFSVVTEQQVEASAAMLHSVVSSIVLCPPKADLRSKGMRYNPEIFYINSNRAWFSHDKVDDQAIWRRRHVLVNCIRTPLWLLKKRNLFKEDCPHCVNPDSKIDCLPQELFEDFHHLSFVFGDRLVPNSFPTICEENENKIFSYSAYISKIKDMYLANRERENALFNKRVQLEQFLGEDTESESIELEYVSAHDRYIKAIKDLRERSLYHIVASKSNNFISSVREYWNYIFYPEIDNFVSVSHLLANGIASCSKNVFTCSNISSKMREEVDIFMAGCSNVERSESCSMLQTLGPIIYDACSKGCKTWEDFIILLQSRYFETPFLHCKHLSYKISSINYDYCSRAFNCDGKVVPLECTEKCIMGDTFLKYFYFKRWLKYQPACNMALRQELYDKLPPYFGQIDVELPDFGTWRDIIMAYARRFILDYVSPICKYIWNFLEKYLPLITFALSAAGLVFFSVKHSDQNPNVWSAPTFPQGPAYSGNQASVVVHNPAPVLVSSYISEGVTQQADFLYNSLHNNIFTITVVDRNERVSVRCLVLKSRTVILLKHFVEALSVRSAEAQFYGKFNGQVCPIEYGILFDFRKLKFRYFNSPDAAITLTSNFAVTEIPLVFKESKNILKFMARREDHCSVSSQCFLVNENINREVLIRREESKITIAGNCNISPVIISDSYSYFYHGEGLCGTLLISPNSPRPIIGMHVAGSGSTGKGIAELLSFEMFENLPRDQVSPFDDLLIPRLNDIEFAKINLEDNCYALGTIDSKFANHQSGVTQFIPSPIQGEFPVLTEPAPLCKNDSRLPEGTSPLKVGCELMGKYTLDFDDNILDESFSYLSKYYNMIVHPIRSEVGVLNLQEAICGIPGISGFEPLEWSTSEGFPLKSLRVGGIKGKKWLFKLEVKDDSLILLGLHPELKRLIAFYKSLYLRNIRPFTVFTDCLKDSLLPADKCRKKGKTRIFSISPVHYTILFKQYLGDFAASFQNIRFNAMHAIGIDCNSFEWTLLVKYLCEVGNNFITLDYTNFGHSINYKVAYYVIQVILGWYDVYDKTKEKNENQHIRACLLHELIGSYHLLLNMIFVPCSGVVSGGPITDKFNSLVNIFYVCCAWISITKNNLNSFFEHVRLVTYGDDVIMSVSDKFIDIFNGISIPEWFAPFRIICTDGAKTGELKRSVSLDDCSFLKRKFTLHPNRDVYLAPIDEISVTSQLNWIKRKGNAEDNLLQNISGALELAFSLGPVRYEFYLDRIIEIMARKKLSFKFLLWRDIDKRCFD